MIIQLLPVGEMACVVLRYAASRGGLGSRQVGGLKGDSWSSLSGLLGWGTGGPGRLRSTGRSAERDLLNVCDSVSGSSARCSLGCRGIDTGAEARDRFVAVS